MKIQPAEEPYAQLLTDIRSILPLVEQEIAERRHLNYLETFRKDKYLWERCKDFNLQGGLTQRELMTISAGVSQLNFQRNKDGRYYLKFSADSAGGRVIRGGKIDFSVTKAVDSVDPKQSTGDREGARSNEHDDRTRDRCLTVGE